MTDDISIGIVAQLIWREYFYTMSAQNVNYGYVYLKLIACLTFHHLSAN